MKLLIILCTVLLLFSCESPTSGGSKRIQQDTIESTDDTLKTGNSYYQDLWNSKGVTNYSFNLEITGFSPDRGEYAVTVMADTLLYAMDINSFTEYENPLPTIDQLFDMISEEQSDSVVTVTVSYDTVMGIPQSISLEWGESMGYRVSNFSSLMGTFSSTLAEVMKSQFTDNEPSHYRYLLHIYAGSFWDSVTVEVRGDSLFPGERTPELNDKFSNYSIHRLFAEIETLESNLGSSMHVEGNYLYDISVAYDTATGVPTYVIPKFNQVGIQVEDLDYSWAVENFTLLN